MAEYTLSDFASAMNVSREAIRKAIKTGRIPGSVIEQRPYGKRQRPVIIDFDAAAAAYRGNVLPTNQREHEQHSRAGKASAAARAGRSPEERSDDGRPASAPTQAAPAGGGPTLAESRRVEAAYKARMAKLNFEKEDARLVDASATIALYKTMVTDARTRLMGVGRRARSRIPRLTIDDVQVIEDLIAEALEDVANAAG